MAGGSADEMPMPRSRRLFIPTRIVAAGASLTPIDPARLARRTALRLGRVRRALTSRPLATAVPGAAPVFSALEDALRRRPAAERLRLLGGPDLRGFLSEAETWIEVSRLAAATARRGRGLRPRRSSPDRARAAVRLFDLISRTEHLTALVPRRRFDAGIPARAARFSERRLRLALSDLSAFLLGLCLDLPAARPLRLTLEARPEPEQGRPPGRIDLGMIACAAGPLAITLPRGRARIAAHLAGRTLTLRAPGAGPAFLPAAGSRIRLPIEASRGPGRRRPAPQAGPRLVRRDTIPGTCILLAPLLVSTPGRLQFGRPVTGLGRRLARALRIVRLAWPEGDREILQRTWMVVPVRERGLVSYSLAARPGVSFINVFGKSIVDLADDLLHETAHHRLHDLQELDRLLAPGPATAEVQAFDSPWRRTRRPLHGLLHGAYTFLFRAELFHRLLRLSGSCPRLLAADLRRHGRPFIRRELRRERAMLAQALRDLGRAARTGLLTRAGRDLLRGMGRWFRRQGTA
jgi:HEXXH motif-containing protein